jgi:hypothetical protein
MVPLAPLPALLKLLYNKFYKKLQDFFIGRRGCKRSLNPAAI